MQIIRSRVLPTLPTIYYVNKNEINDLPIGVPYIVGKDEFDLQILTALVEYKVLFSQIYSLGLQSIAKNRLDKKFQHIHPKLRDKFILTASMNLTYVVDINELINLNLLPDFVEDIKQAVEININKFTKFNPYLYNKKLDICCGQLSTQKPQKNLIIIDISNSIPRSLGLMLTVLAKSMSINFNADVFFHGIHGEFMTAVELQECNSKDLYNKIGRGNSFYPFYNFISHDRSYNNVIVFGDSDAPERFYGGADGNNPKDLLTDNCRLRCNYLHSFYVEQKALSGYAKWIKPKKDTFLYDGRWSVDLT